MLHFYCIEEHDPAFNLALEQVISSETDAPAFFLWRNAPSVILGRNQNAQAETRLPLLAERGVRLVRRETGGGAVYHDLGNVNCSFAAFRTEETPEPTFQDFALPIVGALRSFGIEAEFSGRNDLSVRGRKVSGCAKRARDGRTLFHGTLLFDCDLNAMEELLTPSECKLRAKGVASVRARVMNLRELLPQWDADRFLSEMTQALLREFQLARVEEVPEKYLEKAEALADSKYRTWEWNVGFSPEFAQVRTRRFPCGSVSLSFSIRKGMLRDVKIHGDFFGSRDASELESLLQGAPFRRDALAALVSSFPVGECVEGLSAEDFLTLFET